MKWPLRKPWIMFQGASTILGLFGAAVQDTSGHEWIARTWTAPHAPVGPLTDLVLAKDGFLLVASGEGLRRFDGLTFSDQPAYSRNGNAGWQATAVFVAQNGDIWTGYRGEGVSQQSAENVRFYGLGDHATLRFVRTFWEDADCGLWVGSEGGLTLIRGASVIPQRHPPGQAVYRVKGSANGSLWIATDLGLYEVHDGRYEPVATRTQLIDSRVRDFEWDRDGAIWIATMSGIARLNHGEERFFTKANGLAGDWVRRLVFDRGGRLWAACQGGVSWWTGSRFESLGNVLGKKPEVTAFVPGTAGEYWLATSSGELISVRPASFSLIQNSIDPGNSHLLTITEDLSRHLWYGWNYFGLTEQSEKEQRIAHLRDRPLNRPIAVAPARAGGVWCTGSDARLFRANHGEIFFEEIAGWGDSTPMSAVMEDRQGALWVGSFDHGLAKKTAGQWTIYDVSSGLAGKRIYALHEDSRGTVWVGADKLYFWNGQRFSPWPANGENPFGEIACLVDDRAGVLWVGTQGRGLFRISGEQWRQYSRCHGLIEETVHGIVLDDQDRIWLQGPRGVTRFPRRQLHELDNGKHGELLPDYWSFAEQGVNSATGTRHPTCSRLRNGQILFATTGGAAVFEPNAGPHLAGHTTVTLGGVLIDGQAVDCSEAITVPAGTRRLAIRWAAVNLAHPESIRFRHRLTGLDADWLEDGALREAHYGVLPKGNHRFELQVRDVGTTWHDALPALAVFQVPHWHERWSIRLLAAGALALGWCIIHFARVQQLERQFRLIEAERHRIAGELHDTVEQGLAGIAINLDAASRQLRQSRPEAEKFLASARRLVIRSRDEARQAIWEMHSAHFKTGLFSQIEHAARDLLGGTGMTWEARTTGIVPDLPEEVIRGVLRLALEAITNAARHSKATAIEVTLAGSKESLIVRIADNGVGFETEGIREPNHYGLELMRARADQLDAKLEIVSALGRGTTVELELPARTLNSGQKSPASRKEGSNPCHLLEF